MAPGGTRFLGDQRPTGLCFAPQIGPKDQDQHQDLGVSNNVHSGALGQGRLLIEALAYEGQGGLRSDGAPQGHWLATCRETWQQQDRAGSPHLPTVLSAHQLPTGGLTPAHTQVSSQPKPKLPTKVYCPKRGWSEIKTHPQARLPPRSLASSLTRSRRSFGFGTAPLAHGRAGGKD